MGVLFLPLPFSIYILHYSSLPLRLYKMHGLHGRIWFGYLIVYISASLVEETGLASSIIMI
jgi:hypothetical protein